MTSEHSHLYGPWARDEAADWWVRHCQVEGCGWRQVTSDDPSAPATPWGRAMDRLAGIDNG